MRLHNHNDAAVHPRPYGELVLFAGTTAAEAHTSNVDCRLLLIEVGAETSYHRHFVSETVFHVLEGDLTYRVDDTEGAVSAGDTLIVEPGEFHALRNNGEVVARVMEMQSPPYDKRDRQDASARRGVPRAVRRKVGRFWAAERGVRIKVCGVFNIDAAYLCYQLGVDAIGLHVTGRRRMARVRGAEQWLTALDDSLSVFLLTDCDDPSELVELAYASACDSVQLQGAMAPEAVSRCAEALRQGSWKVVKSIGLEEERANAVGYARRISRDVDAILVDTSYRGGTGRSADWALARRVVAELAGVRVILAGGLTAANVSRAITQVGPWGVDVESGVEVHLRSDFGPKRVTVRSSRKIAAFVEAVRSLHNST